MKKVNGGKLHKNKRSKRKDRRSCKIKKPLKQKIGQERLNRDDKKKWQNRRENILIIT